MTILSAVGILSMVMMILFGAILLVLLPIIAIVDIIRSRMYENDKIIWVIIIIVIPILGSILYFLLAKQR